VASADTSITYTGKYIQIGIDETTASLWNDTTSFGLQLDPTGTSSFAGKPDWLQPDATHLYDFWSLSAAGFNGGSPYVMGWNGTTTLAAPGNGLKSITWNGIAENDDAGIYTPYAAGVNDLSLGNIIHLQWAATLTDPGGDLMGVVRDFNFNKTSTKFQFNTTIYDLGASTLTGLYYGTGFDPGPGLPPDPDTTNIYSTTDGGHSYTTEATYGFPAYTFISMKGQATPYISGAYKTDPATLYNGGVPYQTAFGDTDGNLAIGLLGGTGGALATDNASTYAVTYTFDSGTIFVTPELGTFGLLGASMLPMAGFAIRRRRRSA
jgi:hypothetical protein